MAEKDKKTTPVKTPVKTPTKTDSKTGSTPKLRPERFSKPLDVTTKTTLDEGKINDERVVETKMADHLFKDSKFYSGAVASAAGDTTLKQYLEAKKAVFSHELFQQCKAKVAKAKEDPAFAAIEEDYLLAIAVYTAESPLYGAMNKGLRGLDATTLPEYGVLIWKLMQGIRALRYQWKDVYRGVADFYDMTPVGKLIVMNSFLSTSEVEPAARGFAANGTLYKLRSQSGRSIAPLSCFKKEKEILFRPFTVFKVTKRSEETDEDGNRLVVVEAEEMFPDVRGRKIVLWVDDEPINNKLVMEKAEPLGVTFVWKKTTEEALEFLRQRPTLLAEDLKAFRIITDMRRVENGKEVPDAGRRFINAVRSEFNYKQKILVYRMDPTPLGMEDVEVSVDEDRAFKFASFETEK